MAARIYPQTFTWNGAAMLPLNGKLAARQYEMGETYNLAVHEDRSDASHRHYFAAVNEAFQNLPEKYKTQIPTAEHLRKWALIRAGYRDERKILCGSTAEAEKFKAFIKPMDDFAVVIAEGPSVHVYTAKSQSVRAMGKDDFQKSKQDVLDIVAGLVGVTAEQLNANAGQAA